MYNNTLISTDTWEQRWDHVAVSGMDFVFWNWERTSRWRNGFSEEEREGGRRPEDVTGDQNMDRWSSWLSKYHSSETANAVFDWAALGAWFGFRYIRAGTTAELMLVSFIGGSEILSTDSTLVAPWIFERHRFGLLFYRLVVKMSRWFVIQSLTGWIYCSSWIKLLKELSHFNCSNVGNWYNLNW